jgi:hypothetical protein
MKRLASILLLMLTSATLCAQDPAPKVAPTGEAKIVLEAPSTARVGELVRFDVTASVADSFEWLVVPPSQDFEVYAEGRKAVFSARMPGEFEFIVACAKDGTVDVVRHVIIVRGPPPMPATDALDEWIPFWAYTFNLPTEDAGRLAAVYEQVASRDDLTEPKDWIQATALATRETLGEEIEVWKPLLSKIGEVLLKKAQAGALATPEQHKEQWLEIASGLRKI